MMDHLWQSTLFAAAAWLLTLLLRKHRAGVRYVIWLAASLKFLVPFSLLVGAGSELSWIRPAEIPEVAIAMPAAASFPIARTVNAPSTAGSLSAVLFGLWFCGAAVVFATFFRQWMQIRWIRRAAKPMPVDLPIPVLSAPARLEPGVFGIRNPVLLLPEGIAERLTRGQLEAVLAHELAHVRRRDNLTAALHMLVETIFWFHPLIWWIRMRLIAERERACDEAVLSGSGDPESYAEGILNVCKFYLESPLICAPGVTGADLKHRIENIMSRTAALELDGTRKLALACAAGLVLAGPVAMGFLNPPPINAQAQTVPPGAPAFDVAYVKNNHTGAMNSGFRRFTAGKLDAINITLKMLIAFAYDAPADQIHGGPVWLDSERYDVVAKPDRTAGSADLSMNTIRLRTRALLADRFKLTLHKETRELPVFALVLDKGGPKRLRPPRGDRADLVSDGQHVSCKSASMEFFAKVFLTPEVGRPVLDRTGIKGAFDFSLDWTPDTNTGKAPDPDGPSLFGALREQLGLKLEATKGPVEVFIVDHAEKASEN